MTQDTANELGDALSAWASGSDPRPHRSAASARSYLAGVIIADRLGPRLGLPTRLTQAAVRAITEAALPSAQETRDPAAFRQALTDLRLADGPADMYPVIQRELPDHQREVLQRQLGVPRFGQMAALFLD